MQQLKEFTIKFSGLELGEHPFDYQLDEAFFSHFGYEEFSNEKLRADVLLTKKSNRLEFNFTVNGSVVVDCDVSNTPFSMPISNQLELIVKFGDDYDDSNEEVLIVPHGEFEINIAQQLFECAVLAVPLKKVNPNLEDTEEGRAMLSKLNEFSPDNQKEEKKEKEEIDPRWDKLKDLLD